MKKNNGNEKIPIGLNGKDKSKVTQNQYRQQIPISSNLPQENYQQPQSMYGPNTCIPTPPNYTDPNQQPNFNFPNLSQNYHAFPQGYGQPMYPPQYYQQPIPPPPYYQQQSPQPIYQQQQYYPPNQIYQPPPPQYGQYQTEYGYQNQVNRQPPNPQISQNKLERKPTTKNTIPILNSADIMKGVVKREALVIFDKYDANKSGFLDVREIYPAICHIFKIAKIPSPSYKESLEIMRNFDTDGNGLIDREEFQDLLLILCGMDP